MWTSLSIGKKIWCSISILILGYIVSMVIGTVNGNKARQDMQFVSSRLYPACLEALNTLTSFDKQNKLFQDSLLNEEPSLAKEGATHGDNVAAGLDRILAMGIAQADQQKTINDLREKIIDYNSRANPVFLAMSGGDLTFAEEAIRMANEDFPKMRKSLETLASELSRLLQARLDSSGDNMGRMITMNILFFIGVVFASVVLVSLILSRWVTRPLGKTVVMIKDIARGEGDLTRRLQVTSQDEVGELARWFNQFVANLQEMVSAVADHAGTLNTSSKDLGALSQLLADSSSDMSAHSDTVTRAADDMKNSINTVSAATSEASDNTEFVASATEEMTSTIREIATNSEKTRSITDQAVVLAQKTSGRVAQLGQAAKDIDKVTETITGISEQTNLLALNATIEAARAGDAGKGFAVVANEIKELARQTAQATLDIKTKIEGIQGVTAGTVSDIADITGVITQVNEMVGTMAAAVEEQSVTTQEISENVGRISQLIRHIDDNVSQSSSFAVQIAGDMSEINRVTTTVSDNCGKMNTGTDNLHTLARTLQSMVGVFKV